MTSKTSPLDQKSYHSSHLYHMLLIVSAGKLFRTAFLHGKSNYKKINVYDQQKREQNKRNFKNNEEGY